jgi:hypothetical protein
VFDGPATGGSMVCNFVPAFAQVSMKRSARITVVWRLDRALPVMPSRRGLVCSRIKDPDAGSGLTFEARGSQALKGIPGGWQLFAAVWQDQLFAV